MHPHDRRRLVNTLGLGSFGFGKTNTAESTQQQAKIAPSDRPANGNKIPIPLGCGMARARLIAQGIAAR